MSSRNPVVYDINRVGVPKGIPTVNTDASFKNGVGSYCFMVRAGGDTYLASGRVPKEWLAQGSRGCELYGALQALDYCASKGYRQVGLFFDYLGIYYATKPGSEDLRLFKNYASAMRRLTANMEVFYHKVEGPDDYHKLVDMVSRSNVRITLGGDEMTKLRKSLKGKKSL